MAKGPIVLPSTKTGPDEPEGDENRVITDREFVKVFQALPLSLLGFKDGVLLSHLEGSRILLAIEGARHFRAPSNLGGMLYEGCEIVLFADDLNDSLNSLVRDKPNSEVKTEEIGRQEVAVFQEKFESDIWTTLVALPSKRMLLVATNRDYFSEVLARLGGKKGDRALPSDLLEWKYVNTELRFWGLRHYDRGQAKMDPSSPLGGNKLQTPQDEKAIGLTFGFDQSKEKQVSITYVSGDKSIGVNSDANPLLIKTPEAKGIDISCRKLAGHFGSLLYSQDRRTTAVFLVRL